MRQIDISGVGVRIQPGGSYAAYWKDLLVSLSGPLVNVCVAFAANRWHAMDLCRIHLWLGLFNLLPYPQLDGGAALFACLCMAGVSPSRAKHLQMLTALACSAVLLVVLLHCHAANLSLYCALFYITVCAPLQKLRRTP
ncbi:MAG: hypothetical protein LUC50_05975 [Ruminococcus sp.]|nr:hypothetical protein [Ruminococcus sp.]